MSAAIDSTALLAEGDGRSTQLDDALLTLLQTLRNEGYRFTTVTPATHQRVNRRPDAVVATDLRGVFGWSRTFEPQVLPPHLFEALRDTGVIEPCNQGWRSRVRVSSLGELLLLHSAYPTDAADAVFFGPDSYRFATAIEAYLATRTPPLCRALDIGCGAGPGALAIARSRPEAEVLGTDINQAALHLARVNGVFAGTGNLRFRHSDLFADIEGFFDLIVANPPYLNDPRERNYRHGGGAFGAGLSLAIVDSALSRLSPGGSLLLYTGVAMLEQGDPFLAALRDRPALAGVDWDYRELDPDVFGEELEHAPYARVERIAAVTLTATRSLGGH